MRSEPLVRVNLDNAGWSVAWLIFLQGSVILMWALTPELSRPAAGRRLSANIAEGVHSVAALMWARLE